VKWQLRLIMIWQHTTRKGIKRTVVHQRVPISSWKRHMNKSHSALKEMAWFLLRRDNILGGEKTGTKCLHSFAFRRFSSNGVLFHSVCSLPFCPHYLPVLQITRVAVSRKIQKNVFTWWSFVGLLLFLFPFGPWSFLQGLHVTRKSKKKCIYSMVNRWAFGPRSCLQGITASI